jgi:hypothetical protein
MVEWQERGGGGRDWRCGVAATAVTLITIGSRERVHDGPVSPPLALKGPAWSGARQEKNREKLESQCRYVW